MNLSVAIADVDVDRLALECPEFLRLRARQLQVAHVDVRLHRRMVHVVDEPHHVRHVVQERELERLQFERDLQTEVRRVVAERLRCLTPVCPLLRGRDDLPLPDVLAEHEEQVLGLEFVAEVEIRPAAIEVEPLHAGVEVDQPDRDAGDADDRQPGLVALGADELALLGVDVERVGEDVDASRSRWPWSAGCRRPCPCRPGPRRS